MKNQRSTLLLLSIFLASATIAASYDLSMFYCGFSGNFCGQSNNDDVNPGTTTVILAFANTQSDGNIIVDEGNWPTGQIDAWKSQGKQVLISVGGQNGNWDYVFASETNTNNFLGSVLGVVVRFKLDGVDLDIESYKSPPRTVANMINGLRRALNTYSPGKLIVVSPEDVAVYQGSPVPDPTVGGNPFNYFVPIIKEAGNSIDFYQVQAYNNWYDGLTGGTEDYLKDVYLNWRNFQGLGQWSSPIANFQGVPGNQLLIGVIASTQAGSSAYYAPPKVINGFQNYLQQNNFELKGFMMWDSHWDKLNGFQVSNACLAQNIETPMNE